MNRIVCGLGLIAVALLCFALPASGVTNERANAGKVVLGGKNFMGRYGKGWGKRKPKTIFNGGDANGLVTKIHWKGWGHEAARGRGLGNQFKPKGGYYRKHVKVRLRAQALGHCGKHRAYTKLFAQFQKKPGGKYGRWFPWAGAESICRPPF
jgi:hypothetical protein